MLKFIRKLLYFPIAFVIVASIFFLTVPAQYETNYMASIIDKTERLEHLESPKIILVGNSNWAFGMVSEELEKETGMPVVNLGLNVNMGNKFHENIAKRNIQKGDIVIISHTDYGDNGTIATHDEFWIGMENHYNLWTIPGISGILRNTFNLPRYMVNATRLYITGSGNNPLIKENSIYARSNVNEYGDVIPEANSTTDENITKNAEMPTISATCIKRINRFNEYCKKRGATLLIAAYPIPDTQGRPSNEELDNFQKELEKRLNCPVISNFTDYIFAPENFSALPHHLNYEGAKLRTRQLIKDLKVWQNKNGNNL